jgi:hypothetical protein
MLLAVLERPIWRQTAGFYKAAMAYQAGAGAGYRCRLSVIGHFVRGWHILYTRNISASLEAMISSGTDEGGVAWGAERQNPAPDVVLSGEPAEQACQAQCYCGRFKLAHAAAIQSWWHTAGSLKQQ